MFDKYWVDRSLSRFGRFFTRVDVGGDYLLLESVSREAFKYVPNVMLGVKRLAGWRSIIYFKADRSDSLVFRMAFCVSNKPLWFTCFGDEELLSEMVEYNHMVAVRHPSWLGFLKKLESKYSNVYRTPYYIIYR